jgi:hypothetical protein
MTAIKVTLIHQILVGKSSASRTHIGCGTRVLRGTAGGTTNTGYLLLSETNSTNGVLLMLYLVLKVYNPTVKYNLAHELAYGIMCRRSQDQILPQSEFPSWETLSIQVQILITLNSSDMTILTSISFLPALAYKQYFAHKIAIRLYT